MRSVSPASAAPSGILPVRFFRLSSGTVEDVLFILYFSFCFWEWAVRKLLEPLEADFLAKPAALALICLPVFVLFLTARRKLPSDFFVLFLYLAVYVIATYCFHPEYAYYYVREEYGLLDYVLAPDNGLYAYFFIRLVKEPKRILRDLRFSGYIVYVYSALRLYVATVKGYWMEEGSLGQEYKSSYNMNFGYSLLLFVCCFLYCAFEQGSLRYLLLGGAGAFMILCGGSRGPLLDICVFLVLYAFVRFRRARHKMLIGSGALAFGAGAVFVWQRSILFLREKMEQWNLHSRTLDMMLAGTVAQNNGRDVFWAAAWKMIRDNPFGYGAMGARHVLCGIHIVGHPHNFFIELLIEYGVIAGPLLILLMLAASVRVFLCKTDNGGQGVFLIFFANACQLMTSYTYWHSPALWAALAAGVCFYQTEKRKRWLRAEPITQ